jgi:hypothetical protein
MSVVVFFLKQFSCKISCGSIGWLCVLFFSCQNTHQDQSAHLHYSIYTMDKTGVDYLIETNVLDSGRVDAVQQGSKLSPHIHRDLIVRDGYYYHKSKEQLTRYQLRDKKLTVVDSIVLNNFYIDNYFWVSPDSLLLFGFDKECRLVKMAKLYLPQMSAEIDTLDLEIPAGQYRYTSVGFSDICRGRLLLGYSYHRGNENEYIPCDTMYVGVFSYPQLKKINIIKDTRSTYPGSDNFVEPASFNDENGDFYFLTCPGIALGNHAQKPTALYRIKAGHTTLDTSYYFDVSASVIGNDAYSIYYLGKQKAIIRSEQAHLYNGWKDHWKVPHFQFYVLDLVSLELTKLPLPLDKGTRRQCVLVEGDTTYIAVNAEEGNYIWLYHTPTAHLSKGLQLDSNTNYILRIDKLSAH